MTRFFFDYSDTSCLYRDDEGVELASLEEARKQALGMLGEVAKDALPNGDARVRDKASFVTPIPNRF